MRKTRHIRVAGVRVRVSVMNSTSRSRGWTRGVRWRTHENDSKAGFDVLVHIDLDVCKRAEKRFVFLINHVSQQGVMLQLYIVDIKNEGGDAIQADGLVQEVTTVSQKSSIFCIAALRSL